VSESLADQLTHSLPSSAVLSWEPGGGGHVASVGRTAPIYANVHVSRQRGGGGRGYTSETDTMETALSSWRQRVTHHWCRRLMLFRDRYGDDDTRARPKLLEAVDNHRALRSRLCTRRRLVLAASHTQLCTHTHTIAHTHIHIHIHITHTYIYIYIYIYVCVYVYVYVGNEIIKLNLGKGYTKNIKCDT